MYSEQDLTSLCDFLKSTGEGNLQKMLVDNKVTQTHFRLLMRIAKTSPTKDFVEWAKSDKLPKIKMNAGEIAIRETFWSPVLDKCCNLGLLSKAKAA